MNRTEMRNPATMHIDAMTTTDMVAVMQRENENAARAVGEVAADIGRAIDAVSARMLEGGRLIYIGCGTSGRLGVLDASECPPTYGVPEELVVGIIAGGDECLRRAGEGCEDSAEKGIAAISAMHITEKDSVVGLSAAGGAAFVLAALEYAKEQGALTVGITSNPDTPLHRLADITIAPETGEEVVTGSTRMKAGTAQKMILNMLSTGVMIRQGHVYENMMVNLRPTNVKLRARVIRIVREIAGVSEEEAVKALDEHQWSIRKAAEALKG